MARGLARWLSLLAPCVGIACGAPALVEAQTTYAHADSDAPFCAPYGDQESCESAAMRLTREDTFGAPGCSCAQLSSTWLGVTANEGEDGALRVELATPSASTRLSVDEALARTGQQRRRGEVHSTEVSLQTVRGARALYVVRIAEWRVASPSVETTEETLLLVRVAGDAAPEVLWVGIGGLRLDCFYDSEDPVDPECGCVSERTVRVVVSSGVARVRSRIRFHDGWGPDGDTPSVCVRPAPIRVDVPIP